MAIGDITTLTKTNRLNKISFMVLAALLFLAPVFFVPSVFVPLSVGKSAFILYGITIVLILWCIARLKDGVYSMPRGLIYPAAGILAMAYTLSALFSENRAASLSGQGLELGTLSFVLTSLVLFLLLPMVAKSQKEVFYSHVAIMVSVIVTGLFHIIRFAFGPDTLSFGVLTAVTSNFIGKWNDLGIFFGLGIIFSFITLTRGQVTGLTKWLVYTMGVLSLIMLVVINFSAVWIMLAVLSLVYLVYEMSFGRKTSSGKPALPYYTLAVLVLSVIFIFAGGKIGGVIAGSLNISQVEVRPSWSATYDVSMSTLAKNPLFGAGPNKFSAEWLLYKPIGINNTPFWNVDFNYGIGFVPTLLSTTGIIGFLAVLFFIGLLLVKSAQAIFTAGSSPFGRYLVLSSLFGNVYLWIFSFFYVPSSAIWIVTMALSGLFIASLCADESLRFRSYSAAESPAASFVSVLFTILLLIAALSFGWFVTEKLLANVYFQKGVLTINRTGNLDQGASAVASAISLSPSDVYYQSLSEIYIAKINALLNDQKLSREEAQKQFQSNLSAAIQSAQNAVKIDPTNYGNYLTQGRVFEAVVPLNMEGAYENAKRSYETALTLNPQSPEIYLILARLETAHKDNKAARDYIVKALEKKNDYADAIFLLSQIQIAEKDLPNAIRSVEAVATLSPSDPGIFFQLGLLYYSNKNYPLAVMALERAVSLNPQYANAKYFLGLSYYEVGERTKSLEQFMALETTNADNAEIKTIIKNLESGRKPLSSQIAPEKRSNAPVKETVKENI